MRERAPAGRVLALPNQSPGLIERHGLTRQDVDRSAWVIDAYGNKLAGAAAFNRVLRELPWAWPALAGFYRLPPAAWLEERLYEVVAANRSRLSRLWGDPPPIDG